MTESIQLAWLPINTAPVEEDVIVFSPTHGESKVWIAHQLDAGLGEWAWYPQDPTTWGGSPSYELPTHWMPLPDAPSVPSGNENTL